LHETLIVDKLALDTLALETLAFMKLNEGRGLQIQWYDLGSSQYLHFHWKPSCDKES